MKNGIFLKNIIILINIKKIEQREKMTKIGGEIVDWYTFSANCGLHPRFH